MTPTATQASPVRNMQGIAVPASAVQPEEFFRLTRRHTLLEKTFNYDGTQNVFELRKSDILSTIIVRFTGSLVVTPGTGTVASTSRWPYDLPYFRYTANGASNIVSASGLKLKARELMKRGDLNDRGIAQTIAGATKSQGTFASASESWGVGSNTTGLAAGTYPVELFWVIPVAEDEVDLAGASFLATSTADLTLTLDYLPLTSLFVTTGNATVALTGSVSATSTKFSIPIGPNGIIVPDLSMFHSLIQSQSTALQNGDNEIRLIGQGGGKSLLRAFYQVWNGAGTAAAPLAMSASNFGPQSWRYGNNETPDQFMDGQLLREVNERQFASDLGGVWGIGCHDFASELEFRDVVDMGTTSDLRLVANIANSVSLNTPKVEYVTETVFQAGQAA